MTYPVETRSGPVTIIEEHATHRGARYCTVENRAGVRYFLTLPPASERDRIEALGYEPGAWVKPMERNR